MELAQLVHHRGYELGTAVAQQLRADPQPPGTVPVGDAVRTGNVQLFPVQPDKGFAFASGSESSETRYR